MQGHYRLKGNVRVRWSVENMWVKGEGIISNISVAGMELVTDKLFKVPDECVFLVEPINALDVILKSKRSKALWVKEVSSDGAQCIQCGLEFLPESEKSYS
ncbi:MAG: hypothetical protein WCH62_07635 [Candidatus Omnitrophota bacterium]